MSELDDLKKRKEELLLREEVARLERKARLGKTGGWSWWWVAPLGLLGAFFLVVGLDTAHPVPIVAAMIGLAPTILKIYFSRTSSATA